MVTGNSDQSTDEQRASSESEGCDHLARLPPNLAALVERYGSAREALGSAFGRDSTMSLAAQKAKFESVVLAERRLVDGIIRAVR